MMIKTKVAIKRKNDDAVNAVLFMILLTAITVIVLFIKLPTMLLKPADSRLWLGMETVELTTDIKKQFDIQSSNGLLVSRVFVGSPAQASKIHEGDVIRRWNGTSVTSPEQLERLIQTSNTNERVKITIDRQGESVIIYTTVGTRPGGI
ncbi:MAG: PDZ domain-containing protein [Candidatus Omnitrophica bacterium]|nr:PDZ domain-containing protein [Candidatus Omnitrophota bacterium]